jgi:predicted ATPase/class 3 adenylate cyclase
VPEPPTGIVTFLFSDIEGSTRLLQELGRDAYERAQDEHAAIIRNAIAEGGGVEIRTEGDSFFVVFPTPAGAVRAAAAAQRELSRAALPDGSALRVRMGLHTGEGIRGGGDYLGVDVNRAARIAALGHGGQVLVSEATTALVADSVPEGVRLRDLGRHRLKDFDRPERLHDLEIEGAPSEFPRLRSVDSRRANLPVHRTSFVGRERDVIAIRESLSSARLVTLTGPGGTGKTRLALEVAGTEATRFRDGAVFVDLSALTDPTLVMSSIARALDVRDASGQRLVDAVHRELREQQLLLVLDNLERLLAAGPAIGELLDAAPEVTALATSRAALRLSGEQEYPLAPLALPTPDAELDVLGGVGSVRLFLDRAAAVRPDFKLTKENASAVVEIVARLDGLPLALELAASRLRVLSPDAVAERMGHRLPLLTGGARDAPERQRTLEATIRWSYESLDDPERLLFERLSVFSGGWSLEAAEEICGDGLDVLEGMSRLVENSLVRRTDLADGTSRFAMLETIREFAGERLERSPTTVRDELVASHRRFFRDLAEEAEPNLKTEDQSRWFDALEREHDNIRAALDRAERAGDADDVEDALRTAAAIWRFWQDRGHIAEGRERLQRLTHLPAARRRNAPRARALGALGSIDYWLGDYGSMQASYEEALEIAREVGDRRLLATALFNASFVPMVLGQNLEATAARLREAQEVAGNEDPLLRGQAWISLGYVEVFRGKPGAALEPLERGIAMIRMTGDRLELCESLGTLAGATLLSGDVDAARARVAEATAIALASPGPG